MKPNNELFNNDRIAKSVQKCDLFFFAINWQYQVYDNSNKYHVAIAVCRGEQVLAQRLLGFDLFRQNERLNGGWDEKNFTYPLVMTNIAMENHHL